MKFASGVIVLLLLAGLSIIPSYGLFGGTIMTSMTPSAVQQDGSPSLGGSFAGSAAGGRQAESPPPDVRSCAKARPVKPLP